MNYKKLFAKLLNLALLPVMLLYTFSADSASFVNIPASPNPHSQSPITYYYDDGAVLINEADNSGAMSSYLISGNRVLRALIPNSNSPSPIPQTQWLISDAKSVVATTDDNGKTQSDKYQYDAYGKEIDLNNPTSNNQLTMNNYQLSILHYQLLSTPSPTTATIKTSARRSITVRQDITIPNTELLLLVTLLICQTVIHTVTTTLLTIPIPQAIARWESPLILA